MHKTHEKLNNTSDNNQIAERHNACCGGHHHHHDHAHTHAHVAHDDGHHQIARREKIGRNEPCPCGSGKKYKKCCLV